MVTRPPPTAAPSSVCGGVGHLHQVADMDVAEQVFDAVVDLAQWFFDGAMAGEVAGSVNGDATGDEEWAVDGADDFEGGDLVGRPGEGVAAVGAGVGDEQAGAGEGLQDLGQQRRRDVVGLGDVLGALGGRGMGRSTARRGT